MKPADPRAVSIFIRLMISKELNKFQPNANALWENIEQIVKEGRVPEAIRKEYN